MSVLFNQGMLRLLFGKNLSYLPNDILVTLLNLCLEKSRPWLDLSKDCSFWETIHRILGIYAKKLEFDEMGINPEKVIDTLRRRVEESRKFLEVKGKSLNLTKFKVYIIFAIENGGV